MAVFRAGVIARAAVVLTALAGCDGAGPPAPIDARQCRVVAVIDQATGSPVVGIEDIALDAVGGHAFLSAYDRRAVAAEADGGGPVTTEGGIYRLDISDLRPPLAQPLSVVDATADARRHITVRPHGIDLHRAADGTRVLAAINRPYDDDGRVRPTVELFDVADGMLAHRRTVADDRLCAANDVAVSTADQLFVTHDRAACAGPARWAEDVLGLKRSGVLYLDGDRVAPLISGLGFANGVALERHGKSLGPVLYVAATREDAVHVYSVANRDGDVTASHMARLTVAGGPDNLVRGADGTLYGAAHPSLIAFALYRSDLFGRDSAPSRLFSLKVAGAGDAGRVRTLYAGDGALLSGATAAVRWGDVMLAGAAFDDGLLVCRLDGEGAGA